MRLHIQKYPLHSDVIWVEDETSSMGPFLPVVDRFNLASIDQIARQRTPEFVSLAEEGDWDKFGINAELLAEVISHCITRIQASVPDCFDGEAVFRCPDNLADAVEFPKEPRPISEWLARFPIQVTPESPQ